METAVELSGVSFSYPAPDGPANEEVAQVFSEVSAELPAGMMSIVGRNGIGKSTLLLLAGARLFPQEGSVTILGTDTREFSRAQTDPEVEQDRNRSVSFVYQNMEFETTEPVGDLMQFVYDNGFHKNRGEELLARIRSELEMEAFLAKRTQDLSKGQLQRAIIAFSLLYGSRIIMLDEPVFALEESQKNRVFQFLLELSRELSLPIYYSVHNLDLSQKYSDYVLLFSELGQFTIGPSKQMFTRERIESAYHAPMDTLYRRDQLYRELLLGDGHGQGKRT
ncbi:MAG: ABC transporter ATP-binding protein [Spirochaetaceae bacterium]|nr:ABC transporter ATP-binding protein [Spirochaetaceae bacterium]